MERLEVLRRHLSPQTTASAYRYSVGGGPLSSKDRDFYEKNGFFVVKGLVSVDDLEKFRVHFLDLCNGRCDKSGAMTLMRDITLAKSGITAFGESNVTKCQNFEDDEALFSYCKTPRILEWVSSFIGTNICSTHTMLINKPPDTGKGTSRHPLHQDLYYFPFRPADRIVCSWTAMQRIDRTNGCLVVVPGSHTKEVIRPHGYPNWEESNGMYHGILDLTTAEMNGRIHLEMDAGDTVFFHPLLIHGSGSNQSTGFRKSISCHYASAECHYIDVDGTVQQPIKDEVEDIAKKRGFDVTLTDVWKMKTRLVAGRKGPMV